MPNREYFNNRRKARRLKYINMLGGKCDSCDAIDGLHFDHKDPREKEFRIADRIDAPEEILSNEVNKCRLLCAPCHRKKTRENNEHGQPVARHGTLHMYKQYGCRCAKCREQMSEYNRNRKMVNIAELDKLVNTFSKYADELIIEPNEEGPHKRYKEIMLGESSLPDKAIELMSILTEATEHNPLVIKKLQILIAHIEKKEWPQSFDLLKSLGKNIPEKIHPVILSLGRVIAHLRNESNKVANAAVKGSKFNLYLNRDLEDKWHLLWRNLAKLTNYSAVVLNGYKHQAKQLAEGNWSSAFQIIKVLSESIPEKLHSILLEIGQVVAQYQRENNMETIDLNGPCPSNIEYLTLDTIAETCNVSPGLYRKLWKLTAEAEEAGTSQPLGGDGSDGTTEIPIVGGDYSNVLEHAWHKFSPSEKAEIITATAIRV